MSKTIVTHDGKFHADDVFAVAALFLREPSAKIIRTRDEAEIRAADFVVDVGGVYDEGRNRFDHHQVGGALFRGNGVAYAAFGLVWKKFGEELSGSARAAARRDAVLAVPLDAHANGVDLVRSVHPSRAHPYDIPDAIRAFTPAWSESEETLAAGFEKALSLALSLLEREIIRARSFAAGEEKVLAAYRAASDKRLVILDNDYSWKDALARFPEPLFVVHPQDEGWRLYSVRSDPESFENRTDLPESWAGLRDAELAKVTGVPDAVFCHRNRFMAVAKTREGALALAKLVLAN